MQQNLATITEVSQGGQVPNLKFTNLADGAVLLVEGEELIGAKQNRVLNTTILVRPKSELNIPVSCTEAGRWSYNSPTFSHSGHLSPWKLRRSKSSSVAAALEKNLGHKSDQAAVWNDVFCCALHCEVPSPTHSLPLNNFCRKESHTMPRKSITTSAPALREKTRNGPKQSLGENRSRQLGLLAGQASVRFGDDFPMTEEELVDPPPISRQTPQGENLGVQNQRGRGRID